MKVNHSSAIIIRGAQASETLLELEAGKLPNQPVLANAIVYKAPEPVTLESLEQCWSYLVAVEPDIQPIQLVHQVPHSPKVWAPDSPKVVYLPGTTKGASAEDSSFCMRGEKPPRWPDGVDLVIYRTEPGAPQVPYVWFTQSQKFQLFMLLTPPGEDWIQLKVRVRSSDVEHARHLLQVATQNRAMSR